MRKHKLTHTYLHFIAHARAYSFTYLHMYTFPTYSFTYAHACKHLTHAHIPAYSYTEAYMYICTYVHAFSYTYTCRTPVWIPPKAENARNAAGEFRPGTPYLFTCHTHACLADMRTYILTCDNVNTCLHSYIQTYKHTYILACLLCGLQKHQICNIC